MKMNRIAIRWIRNDSEAIRVSKKKKEVTGVCFKECRQHFFPLNFISSPYDLCSAEYPRGKWNEKLCVVPRVGWRDEFAVSTRKNLTCSYSVCWRGWDTFFSFKILFHPLPLFSIFIFRFDCAFASGWVKLNLMTWNVAPRAAFRHRRIISLCWQNELHFISFSVVLSFHKKKI